MKLHSVAPLLLGTTTFMVPSAHAWIAMAPPPAASMMISTSTPEATTTTASRIPSSALLQDGVSQWISAATAEPAAP